MTLRKKWSFIFDHTADKQFAKLDHNTQTRILHFFGRVLQSPNPKTQALQMVGNKKDFWRYRIGSYRVICRFEDEAMIIVAVKVGHRKNVYH
jgi:mRNA interferase RelE/StbE